MTTGASFLDRTSDLERLRGHLSHGLNTLLIAPRRTGKSSLILETFRRHREDALCVYTDVFTAGSAREIGERVLEAFYEATATKTTRVLDWVREHLGRLQVSVTMEAVGLSIRIEGSRNEEKDLEAVLDALEAWGRSHGRPVWLAINEFQRLLELRGGEKAAGHLRTVVQRQEYVTYVFSGSKKHVLLGLVEDDTAPFWGQLEVLELQGIPVSEFATYAKRVFRKHGHTLDDRTLTRIGDWCRSNPKRIQEVLLALLLTGADPTPERVDEAVQHQLEASSHMLRSTLDHIKAGAQIKLLRGLAAAEDEATTEPHSKAFVERYRLGTPATVQVALRSLTDHGLLDDDHRFTDPFLKWHLRGAGPA